MQAAERLEAGSQAAATPLAACGILVAVARQNQAAGRQKASSRAASCALGAAALAVSCPAAEGGRSEAGPESLAAGLLVCGSSANVD